MKENKKAIDEIRNNIKNKSVLNIVGQILGNKKQNIQLNK